MAGVRQDPLAVGLCQSRPDLLHDRPLPRRTRTAAVFHRRIRWYIGQRLLGRLQRSGLQLARVAWSISFAICIPWSTARKADLTGRSFPKSCGDCWAMRSACDNKARLAGGKLRLPAATDWRTPGRTDCHHVAGCPGKAVGQKAAATSRPPVHIPRQTGSPLFDNNLAECAVRPAVIIRKNSYANHSQQGADVQAVLMTLYRTLDQRGHNPLQTITQALATYVTTGELPPLPQPITSEH